MAWRRCEDYGRRYDCDNVVIGAGSIVTKNIPDNVIAVGNPCRVLRPITDADKIGYLQSK